MATETLNINGWDSGWPTGPITNAEEAIADADGNSVSTTIDDDVVIFDLSPSVVTDGDTVTDVGITVRALTTGTGGKDSLAVDFLIGGVAQGAGQVTGGLSGSFEDFVLSLVDWDSDWTAAQMAGAQVQVRANQTGKADTADWEIDCIDVIVTYSPGAVVNDRTVISNIDVDSEGLSHVIERTRTHSSVLDINSLLAPVRQRAILISSLLDITDVLTAFNGASWKADLNTDLTGIDVNSDVNLRLRTELKLTSVEAATPAFKYEKQKNSGGYADLTASSSDVKTRDTTYFADGDDCDVQLLGSDILVTNNNAAEESSGVFTMGENFTVGDVIESEVSFVLVSADLADGDVIDFRIVESDGTVFDTYTQIASITVTKVVGGDQVRVLSSSIAVSDPEDISRLRQQIVASQLDIDDIQNIFRERFKTLIGNVAATDSLIVAKFVEQFRSLQDEISVSDLLRISKELFRLMKDSVDAQDLLDAQREINRALVETVEVQDSLLVLRESFRLLVDNIDDVSDAVIAVVVTEFAVFLSDTIDVSDIITPYREAFRILADQADAQDQLEAYRLTFKILNDSATVQDELKILRETCKILVNSLEVSDVLSRELQDFIVNTIILSDDIVIADSLLVFRNLSKRMIDNLSVTDVALVFRNRCRAIADSIDTSDALIREILISVGVIERTITDSISLSEVMRVDRKRMRVITSAMDVNDTLLIARETCKIILDNLETSDTSVKGIERTRILLSSLELTDLTKISRDSFRALINSVSVSDDVLRQVLLFRMLNENVDISDSLIRSLIVFTTTNVIISMILELLQIDMEVSLRPISMLAVLRDIEIGISKSGV